MEILLLLIIVLALFAAFVLRRQGRALRAQSGLPIDARVIYSDTGGWERVEKPLYSRRYKLTGKPDYIVQDETGVLIPIEVKPNRTAAEPRYSDTMQLVAYGVLMQEQYGARPTYGLMKYRDRVFQIDMTQELYDAFFQILDEMRTAQGASDVARSHDDPLRCRYCGYRAACDERLE